MIPYHGSPIKSRRAFAILAMCADVRRISTSCIRKRAPANSRSYIERSALRIQDYTREVVYVTNYIFSRGSDLVAAVYLAVLFPHWPKQLRKAFRLK